MKKLFYGLGAIAAVVTPVVAVVSCGTTKSNKITIGDGTKFEQQGAGENKLSVAIDKVKEFINAHPEAKLININIDLLSTLGVTEWHFQKDDSGMWVNSERLMVMDLFKQLKMNVTNVSDEMLEKFIKRFDEQKVSIPATDDQKDSAWEGVSDVIGGSSAQDKLDAKDAEWLKTLTAEEISKLMVEAGNSSNENEIKSTMNNIGIILGYSPATLDSIDLGADVSGKSFRQEIVEMVTKNVDGQLDTVKLLAQKGVDLADTNPFTDKDFVEIYDQNYNGIDGYKAMTPLMRFNINE